MKSLLSILVCLSLGLVGTSGSLLAQSASGAEARLQERNITLPPVPAPVANYVDFVRVGNLLFLAGNTAGADWKFKGKVGKDITVQEGYETVGSVQRRPKETRSNPSIVLATFRATGGVSGFSRLIESHLLVAVINR
jgi:hypothetical protein